MSTLPQNLDKSTKMNLLINEAIEARFQKDFDKYDYEVNLCKNREGGSNLIFNVQNRDIYVHSNYNPSAEAKAWCESIPEDTMLVIVLGLGLGYHIEELLKKLKKQAKIFIIEPDIRVLKYFLENNDLTNKFEDRVVLSVKTSPETIAGEIYEVLKDRLLSKVDFKIYTSYISLYEDLFEKIKSKLSDIIKTLHVNVSTSEYFKYIWTLNFMANSHNILSASNGKILKNKFENIPAIIVSAGPSLNKNVELLNGIKNKALIIAGGSAIGILNKNGIKPHFLFAMDGDEKEKDIFEGIDFNNITLAYVNRLYYEITKAYPEKKFVFIDGHDQCSKYFVKKIGMDLMVMDPDQTVAGFNINLAHMLGCNPIIFVGQDLAYTDLQMHAEGAAHMVSFTEELEGGSKRFIKTKDIYGDETYTIKQFLTAKLSMELKIKNAIKDGHMFINATQGGIGLDNCENMDLDKVIDKYLNSEYNIYNIIEQSFEEGKFEISSSKIDDLFAYMFEEAEKLKNKAMELNDICKKIRKILMSDKFCEIEYSKIAKKINTIQTSIEVSEFYKEIVVGAIEQIIAIHKMIMEKTLQEDGTMVQKNLTRTKFISNQAVEIIGFCNFIISIQKEYINKI